MAMRIEPEAEVIPGYKLLERLGSGGFGEVWKAVAPGGIFKAIKIIHGDLRSKDNDLLRYAEQELKALKRVKMVRHPYLLALDRYDIIDGRLLITMELADCNLWDRYRECRDQGMQGIPRDELLVYMSETAEVLDLMNDLHQLQHLDIKPQNLFLLHTHVKVADFGQVKDLEGMVASVTGGITPVYAAPETFDGIVTRYCDQYSLACVYQELLTGQRPFDGTSMSHLLMQHTNHSPNLQPSPPGERPVLERALAKKPEDRWPSVALFVRALRDGSCSGSATLLPSSTTFRSVENPLTVLSDRPASEWDTPGPRSVIDTAPPVFHPAPPEQTGDGPFQPTLVIGLGQAGLRVVQRVRFDLKERFGRHTPAVRTLFIDTDPDTLDEAARGRGFERLAALTPDEVYPAKLNRPGYYQKPRLNGRSLTEGWFDPQILFRIPRVPQTMGLRVFGRLAFCDHYRPIVNKIQGELDAMLHPEAIDRTLHSTGRSLRTNRPRVYVVTGLAGGTGSGMFLDLAYAVRGRLRKLGYEAPEIIGIFLIPPADPTLTTPQLLGNTYASLTELNHFSRPGATFTAQYDDRQGSVREKSPPFSRWYLLPGLPGGLNTPRTTPPGGSPPPRRTPSQIAVPSGRARSGFGIGTMSPPGSRSIPNPVGARTGDMPESTACPKPYADAAEFIRLNLFSPLGQVADENRSANRVESEPARAGVEFATFGLAGFAWPRTEVVGRAAAFVARAVLDRWVSPDIARAREVIPGWAAARWSLHELDPETVLGVLHNAAEQAAGRNLETLIADTAEPFAPRGWLSRSPDPHKVRIALDNLVGMFGPPTPVQKRTLSHLEDAVAAMAVTISEGRGHDLKLLGPELVEDPSFRLSGAEDALRQFLATTDRLVERYVLAAAEIDGRAQSAYEVVSQYSHFKKAGKKSAPGELADSLRQFARNRLQALLTRQLICVYQSVRENLAGQLADLTACRQRLTTAAEKIIPGYTPEVPASPRHLMPPGCPTVIEAVEKFLKVLTDDDMDEIDRRAQGMIEPETGGLYHACLNSAVGVDFVVGIVREEAQAYLEARLGEVNLAAMVADRFPTAAAAERAMGQAFADAEPGWVGSGPWVRDEIVVLALPSGPTGQPVRDIAARVVPVAGLPTANDPNEITFYREYPAVPLTALAQVGPAAEAAYKSQPDINQCSLHSRLDITQWTDIDAE